MTGAGRPLRFLLLLSGGWIAVRAVMLWPPAGPIVDAVLHEVGGSTPAVAADVMASAVPDVARVSIALPERAPRTAIRTASHGTAVAGLRLAVREQPMAVTSSAAAPSAPSAAPDPVGRAPAASTRRWTASAWLVARDGGGATLAPGGTLAGSQAGLRIAYRPLADSSLAVFGRASSPLQARGAEAAVGLEVQPLSRIPVRAAIEQRFALEDGAADGTAVSLIGGVGDVVLGGGFRLDGYGQAGVIGLGRRAAFADGAVRIMRPVGGDSGPLAIGAGAWGAAQPGLSRLDIGPRAEIGLPIARQRVRLGAEWRARIAGNARPGSGPALTLGADF